MTVSIAAVDHLGIRVLDADRSIAFYEKLGFRVVARHEPAKVVILRNAAGVEINLIVNADPSFDGQNVLMDGPAKAPGYTHAALRVDSIEQTIAALDEVGIALSDGPVRLGGARSMFVRDPDRNVVELREGATGPGT